MPISIPHASGQTDKTVTVLFNISSLHAKPEALEIIITTTYVKVSYQQYLQYVVLTKDVDISDATCTGPDKDGVLTFTLKKQEPGVWPEVEVGTGSELRKQRIERIEAGDSALETHTAERAELARNEAQGNNRRAEGGAGRLDDEARKTRERRREEQGRDIIRSLVDATRGDSGRVHEPMPDFILDGIASKIVKTTLNGNVYQLPARESRPIESIPTEVPLKQAGLGGGEKRADINPLEQAEKARSFFDKEQYEDCLAALDLVLSSVPMFIPAHSSRCSCLLRLGRYEDALKESRDAIRLSMDKEATKGMQIRKCDLALLYEQRAVCLLLVNDVYGAYESINTAYNLDPTNESIAIDKDSIAKRLKSSY